jgi:hypothetical protein
MVATLLAEVKEEAAESDLSLTQELVSQKTTQAAAKEKTGDSQMPLEAAGENLGNEGHPQSWEIGTMLPVRPETGLVRFPLPEPVPPPHKAKFLGPVQRGSL